MQHAKPLVRFQLCALVSGVLAGGCGPLEFDDVDASKNVAGDDHSSTNIENADFDDVNVDIDLKNEADVEVNVGVGAATRPGGIVGLGDGFSFEYVYQGPIDERAAIFPNFDGLDVSAVEWWVRAPVFGPATIFDDAEAFEWGVPDTTGAEHGDEYLLTVRYGAEASASFTWTTESVVCVDECAARAVSAVCGATIVARIVLSDGSTREALVEHHSARPTCG